MLSNPMPVQKPYPPVIVGGSYPYAGRDRSSCPITICLYPEELDAFAPDQFGALARYEALGVTRCIVGLNPEKRDAILSILGRWVRFMRELRTAGSS